MNTPQIEIAGRSIGSKNSPYLVAELSANHGGSIGKAKRLIELAKRAGANAVKLQTYTPETITIDCDNDCFRIENGPWAGYTLYELYSEAQTPFDWHEELFAHARNVGITIFSSPFDHSAVDLLESLDAPAYKIASFEIVDLPLIEKVASTGKPVILSTGLAKLEEIAEAIDVADRAGCRGVALLHCVSAYPSPARQMHLSNIADLRTQFNRVSGLSDHSLGSSIAIAGVALGASIVEKHFIESRQEGGPDAGFSMEPAEFSNMAQGIKDVSESIGKPQYGPRGVERQSQIFRRSIFVIKDVAKGELLTEKNIRIIRPGLGLAPKYWTSVLERRAIQPIEKGTPLDWRHFE